jgi:hypothetical protein
MARDFEENFVSSEDTVAHSWSWGVRKHGKPRTPNASARFGSPRHPIHEKPPFVLTDALLWHRLSGCWRFSRPTGGLR